MRLVTSAMALLAMPGVQHQEIMDPILAHPAISALSIDVRPRSRLKNKHKSLFSNIHMDRDHTCGSTLLFDELALVACSTEVVCRKELFETYAAATYIHAKFPHVKRIADLAAGHGLLSWFLLVLDHYDTVPDSVIPGRTTLKISSDSRPRTVVCVDRRMPASADTIANAMIQRFPQLEPRWSYIQSDLSAIVPDPSCLLTSVHACGTLTDYLIEIAIGDSMALTSDNYCTSASKTSAPLAVVPCCHTVKAHKGYRPHFLSGMDAEEVAALVEEKKKNKESWKKHEVVADVVDEVRCETLRNAGFDVEEIMLPESFTARNRLLIGKPTVLVVGAGSNNQTERSKSKPKSDKFFERKNPAQPPLIRIPLADDETSISYCRSISGRAHANTRLLELIPNHYSPSLVLSIWISKSHAGEANSSEKSSILLETLQALANQCCSEIEVDGVQCRVEAFGEVNVQSATGRRSQRYRFTYKKLHSNDTSVAGVSKIIAKRIQSLIRERIVDEIGHDVLR